MNPSSKFARTPGAVAIALALTCGAVATTSTVVSAKDRGAHTATKSNDGARNERGKGSKDTSSTTPTTTTPAPAPSTFELPEDPTPTLLTTSEPTPVTTTAPVDVAATSADEDVVALSQGTSLADVVDQIGADDLWAAGYTGAGIDVAVIDTGVALIDELSESNVYVGADFSFERDQPELVGVDTYGHGTHMAGIIAGRTPGADPLNPQPGDFIGVAPDARIVSVKVADNTGAADVSQVIAAIDWVIENRQTGGLDIRVLNLSYNTTGTQSALIDPLSKAVENAWHNGIVVVVSAGNEGRDAAELANPANNPYVLAVSTGEFADGEWSIPDWAPAGSDTRAPDVLAPGVSIASLRNPGSRIDTENVTAQLDDTRLFLGSGTSQSAAVVSGAAALLLQQRPDLTPDEVKNLLTETAVDLGTAERIQGNGVIDLVAAMDHTPSDAAQQWERATGTGLLEASRGDDYVEFAGERLEGERTYTGEEWDSAAWLEGAATWLKSIAEQWSDLSLSDSSWSGSSWSGSSWSGSSWSGSSWSGSSWSGSSWSGSSWSGSSWSGSSWSGSSWSGSSWS